jgi:hypothetical protein
MPPIHFELPIDAAEEQSLRQRLSRHTILERVLRDGLQIEDVVPMDEYTHDVLVALGPRWLVYDST